MSKLQNNKSFDYYRDIKLLMERRFLSIPIKHPGLFDVILDDEMLKFLDFMFFLEVLVRFYNSCYRNW